MFHPALLAAQSVALAGVGFVPPSAIAVSDFKNATYSIGESSVAIGDMWEEDAVNWGAYSASDVDAGAGLRGSSPVSAAALFSVLDVESAGFSCLFEWVLTSAATSGTMNVYLAEFPNYTVYSGFATRANTFFDVTLSDLTNSDSDTWSGAGAHKTAATFTPSLLALSIDGNAAITIVSPDSPVGATDLALQLPGNDNYTLEKITFYAAQDAATLAALSA